LKLIKLKILKIKNLILKMTSQKNSQYIQIKNYILKEDIGEGNFGKVKLGISKTTKEEFAIKIINKDQIKINKFKFN
jgi:serine/threonine protein kinase